MKSITLSLLLAVALLVTSATAVSAEEVTQEQELKTEVECTTGAYGQTSTCKAKAEGKQKQKVVLAGKVLGAHKTVDAGLDFATMSMAAGSIVTGAGAYALKRKLS